VALVGYGTDNATGLDYYILRNSWGAGWSFSFSVSIYQFFSK
jgi:hypothetical protein